jgi:hypothetical protein
LLHRARSAARPLDATSSTLRAATFAAAQLAVDDEIEHRQISGTSLKLMKTSIQICELDRMALLIRRSSDNSSRASRLWWLRLAIRYCGSVAIRTLLRTTGRSHRAHPIRTSCRLLGTIFRGTVRVPIHSHWTSPRESPGCTPGLSSRFAKHGVDAGGASPRAAGKAAI